MFAVIIIVYLSPVPPCLQLSCDTNICEKLYSSCLYKIHESSFFTNIDYNLPNWLHDSLIVKSCSLKNTVLDVKSSSPWARIFVQSCWRNNLHSVKMLGLIGWQIRDVNALYIVRVNKVSQHFPPVKCVSICVLQCKMYFFFTMVFCQNI